MKAPETQFDPRNTQLGVASAGITHAGLVREHNEDNLLCRDDLGLWAVADGMGGHDRGDVASGMVIDALHRVRAWTNPRSVLSDVISRLEETNNELVAEAAKDGGTMGATVVSLLLRPPHGVIAWCGDSRAYRVRGDEIVQLTKDHTMVQDLVEAGQLTADEAEVHPNAHMLTRAVGAHEALELSFEQLQTQPGDLFFLCSDGVSKYCSPTSFVDVARSARLLGDMCEALLDKVLAGGAEDNATVIVVKVD